MSASGQKKIWSDWVRYAQPAVCDLIAALVHNRHLHFTVCAAAQMPVLSGLIEGLCLRKEPVLNLHLRNRASRRQSDLPSVKVHRALLDALRAGDGAAAKAA